MPASTETLPIRLRLEPSRRPEMACPSCGSWLWFRTRAESYPTALRRFQKFLPGSDVEQAIAHTLEPFQVGNALQGAPHRTASPAEALLSQLQQGLAQSSYGSLLSP